MTEPATTETPPADPDRADLVPRTGVPLPTAAAINQWQWLRGAHAETLLVNAALQLNSRPRKTLNWDTPAQRLDMLINTNK